MKKVLAKFSKTDKILWSVSVAVIVVSFSVFDRENYLTLAASLVGVTSLIFNAKANPFGQFLMMVFSILYGIISYSFAYYGEMITYMGMTGPMALLALIAWLKNPYNEGDHSQVKVNKISKLEGVLMFLLSLAVTGVFYFILKAFNTTNLALSTVSVTTSFIAVYLTFRRTPFFAAAYAANDVVLIALWILAAASDVSYISVVICFIIFLINDIYGFVSWLKLEKIQRKDM